MGQCYYLLFARRALGYVLAAEILQGPGAVVGRCGNTKPGEAFIAYEESVACISIYWTNAEH